MAERSLRLRVLWLQPVPGQCDGKGTEFGMQNGRSDLQSGITLPDGSTAYETEVQAYIDKQGRLRFRGGCAQGPPDEPFLYLSWRFANEAGWIGRGKALLTTLTEDFLSTLPVDAALETKMSRLGHRDPGHVQTWRVV